MSGTLNPLAAQGGQAPSPTPNPLASGTIPPPQQQQAVPAVGDVVGELAKAQPSPHALVQGISRIDYLAATVGKLAGNPDVNRKDVVKATADAVGARRIGAEEGITFISQMPEKPEHVRPWLQQKYPMLLVGAVALKAHAHQMVNAASQGAPGGGGAPGGAMPGPAAPGPVAAPGGVA
jgi:hypothetical protein